MGSGRGSGFLPAPSGQALSPRGAPAPLRPKSGSGHPCSPVTAVRETTAFEQTDNYREHAAGSGRQVSRCHVHDVLRPGRPRRALVHAGAAHAALTLRRARARIQVPAAGHDHGAEAEPCGGEPEEPPDVGDGEQQVEQENARSPSPRTARRPGVRSGRAAGPRSRPRSGAWPHTGRGRTEGPQRSRSVVR